MKDMLLDYADKYPHYEIHDKGRNTPEPANYSAKIYAQSLDEAGWFSDVCRVYSVVKPLLKKGEVEKIEKGLLKEGAGLLVRTIPVELKEHIMYRTEIVVQMPGFFFRDSQRIFQPFVDMRF